MINSLQLNFAHLPLVEAALRVSFRKPVPLSFAILNRLRDKLGNEFRNLDEISQIEAPPGVAMELTLGVGQIPGAILSGNPLGLRMTVQQSVVVSRWILEPLQNAPGYPRFGKLRDPHWRVVQALLEVSGVQNPEFGAVNMSYSNFLNVGGSPNVLGKYFSHLLLPILPTIPNLRLKLWPVRKQHHLS